MRVGCLYRKSLQNEWQRLTQHQGLRFNLHLGFGVHYTSFLYPFITRSQALLSTQAGRMLATGAKFGFSPGNCDCLKVLPHLNESICVDTRLASISSSPSRSLSLPSSTSCNSLFDPMSSHFRPHFSALCVPRDFMRPPLFSLPSNCSQNRLYFALPLPLTFSSLSAFFFLSMFLNMFLLKSRGRGKNARGGGWFNDYHAPGILDGQGAGMPYRINVYNLKF